MNKLVFDANVISLYAPDYEYLQDSVETYTNTLFRQLIKSPGVPSIIQGFDLQTDSTYTLKVIVNSSTGLSSLINAAGTVVEITEDVTGIDIQEDGPNYVYAHYIPVEGSYSTSTGTIIDGEKLGIDLSTYVAVFTRQRDTVTIEVMTAIQQAAVTSFDNYIYLGCATVAGGLIVSISYTDVEYTELNIPSKSIEVSDFAADFMMPQTLVEPTALVDIDDSFPAATTTSTNLLEDLNQVRSEIRAMKGTGTWGETSPSSLLSNDSGVMALHESGVIPWEYGTHETYTIETSTGGQYIHFNSGKELVAGSVSGVARGSEKYINLNTVPTYLFSSTGSYERDSVVFSSGGASDGVPLSKLADHAFIDITADPDNIVLAEYMSVSTSSNPLVTAEWAVHIDEYDINHDFFYDTSTDLLYTNKTAGTYYIDYRFGYNFIQSVDVNNNSVYSITNGVEKSYPAKPGPIANNSIRLFNIMTYPYLDSDTADIQDARTYVNPVREVIDISAVSNTSVIPYTTNRFSYHNAADPLLSTNWTASSTDYMTTNTSGVYATTAILAKGSDDIYLRITRPYYATTRNISISIDGGTATTPTINVTSGSDCDNMLMYIGTIPATSTGYHTIKITTTDALAFKLWGLVYGKLGTRYNLDNAKIGSITALPTGLVGIGITNPSYKLDVLTSKASDLGINVLNNGGGINSSNYGIVSNVTGAGTYSIGVSTTASGATLNYGLVSTATGATAYNISAEITASGTATSSFGIRLENTSTAGTKYGIESLVTGAGIINYGISVSASGATLNRAIDITGPAAGTGNYAIYSAATAPSYFGGNIGIGSLPTTNRMEVAISTPGASAIYASHAGSSGNNYTIQSIANTANSGTNCAMYLMAYTSSVSNKCLYIEHAGTGLETDWAIYSPAEAQSYFNGSLGIGITVPLHKLSVVGRTNITGITTLTSTQAATNTTSGALQVGGGVGIAGATYIGGALSVGSTLNVTGITTLATGLTGILQATSGVVSAAGTTGSGSLVYSSGPSLNGGTALTTNSTRLNLLTNATSTTGTNTTNIVFSNGPTITSPVIDNISPSGNFTITQGVEVIRSAIGGAVINTLFLSQGRVGINTNDTSSYTLNTEGSINATVSMWERGNRVLKGLSGTPYQCVGSFAAAIPTGATYVYYILVGGGGGGAGGGFFTGGTGGCSISGWLPLSALTSGYIVVAGAGGAGGAQFVAGTKGGSTYFYGLGTLKATGGWGGQAGTVIAYSGEGNQIQGAHGANTPGSLYGGGGGGGSIGAGYAVGNSAGTAGWYGGIGGQGGRNLIYLNGVDGTLGSGGGGGGADTFNAYGVGGAGGAGFALLWFF